MIASSCRVGLRRATNLPPRNGSGTPSNIEYARFRLQPSHATRRYNGSKPEKGAGTPQSIPGPSWLWLDPIIEPFRAYGRVQQRRPYRTQLISSLVIYFVGDLVAQNIAQPATPPEEQEPTEEAEEKGWVQQWSEERDWARTGRALAIGGISSIPSYKWFLWLSNSFNYSSKILSLTTKVSPLHVPLTRMLTLSQVAVNQVLFTPIFNSYFFGMQSLLSGATGPEIVERIKNTVPTSWINSCKLWPIVTAFSFTYVPIQYRSIFGGVIAIGWQTYLSLLNERAAAEEEKEYEGGNEVAVGGRVVEAERVQQKQKCAA
jgi:protein Mpv17